MCRVFKTKLAAAALTFAPPPRIFADTNNVGGQIPAPKTSTKTITYLGLVGDLAGCERMCSAAARCTSFTWHHLDFSADWAGQCFGRDDGVWAPLPQDKVDSGKLRSFVCETDDHCSLNGACVDGACECDAGWEGDWCQRLRLKPAARFAGKMDFDAATGKNISSWGGSVVRGDDGLYHMFSAEMSGHCGIDAWLANSVIVHSTSTDPLGLYRRRGILFDVFSHEPCATRAPTGEYVLYFTSTLWSGGRGGEYYPASGGQPPVPGGSAGYCRCTNGATPPGGCGGRNWSMALPTFMSWSRTPLEPASWSEPVAVPPMQLSPLVDTNLCPHIFANGSLLGLWRNDDDRGSIHMTTAAHWKDPSSYVQYGARSHPSDPGREDADLWLDARGRLAAGFHAISHSFDRCGYHSFSRDGRRWSFAPAPGGAVAPEYCAFTYDVQYEGGEVRSFARRERPHLIFGADGTTPVGLSTSVVYGDADASYTLVQPIDSSAGDRAGASTPARARGRRARPTGDGAARAAESAVAAAAAAADGCEETGGNEFFLHEGGRKATLCRTGIEGLDGFDDGRGNVSQYDHDDFALELLLTPRDGGSTQRLALGSAQDTDSRRACALVAAGCARGGASAVFSYRCCAGTVPTVQVEVLYSLPADGGFVHKQLRACALRGEACDAAANATVVREVVWDGLRRL